MLNSDHMRNLRARADAVASSIHRSWMHFQVISGLREAATKDPESPLAHPAAFDAIYRAAFDALYVAIGQVTDTRNDTESLHTLVKMACGYPIDRTVIRQIESVLVATQLKDGSPLHRLRRWRDKHTAHRTLEASTPEFYADNRLELPEIETAIAALDSALSEITMAILGVRYEQPAQDRSDSSKLPALLSRYAA